MCPTRYVPSESSDSPEIPVDLQGSDERKEDQPGTENMDDKSHIIQIISENLFENCYIYTIKGGHSTAFNVLVYGDA